MKIESISVNRWNSDTPEPILLDAAFNLAEYGFFQRGSVKEFLTFATRTLAKRLPSGIHCVEYEGKFCYAFVSAEGLSGIAITDKDYPARVIISLLKELVNEMKTGENS
jgi:synaptobrevin homolog YKT6